MKLTYRPLVQADSKVSLRRLCHKYSIIENSFVFSRVRPHLHPLPCPVVSQSMFLWFHFLLILLQLSVYFSFPILGPRSTKLPTDFLVKQVSPESAESSSATDGTINGATGSKTSNSDRVPTFFSDMEMRWMLIDIWRDLPPHKPNAIFFSFAQITLGQDGSVPTDAFLRSCSSLVKILGKSKLFNFPYRLLKMISLSDHLGAASFAPVKMDLNANLRVSFLL